MKECCWFLLAYKYICARKNEMNYKIHYKSALRMSQKCVFTN